MNPDVEKILKLKPDVVISGGGIQKKKIKAMEKLGIKVIVMYPEDLYGIVNNTRLIGRLTGKEKKAEKKLKAINKAAETGTCMKNLSAKVYAELWNEPAMGIGGSSFVNHVIMIAGGHNVLFDSTAEYPKVSKEEIVKRNPDIILLLYDPEKNYSEREYFKLTSAGKKGNIFVLGKKQRDLLLRPGPRTLEAVKMLKKIFNKAVEK